MTSSPQPAASPKHGSSFNPLFYKTRKYYSAAFWDRLVRLGVQPVEVAPLLHYYSEARIAEEMTAARLRLDEDARERSLRRQMLAPDLDLPGHLRQRSAACIPQGRSGLK